MKFFRTEYRYLLAGIIILLIMPIQSFGLDNGYAKIVYNVTGLQNYQLHWNDRFPPDSILMIYVEANGINHRRAVGVDYIFIIKDPNDNIVDTIVYDNRSENYRENDFVKYSKEIGEDWEDGTYLAEIHIFDLLNDSIMTKHYINVTHALLNGKDEPEIPYMNRSDIMNSTELMDRQYKYIIQNFYIDKYADKYPTNRFIIENMSLDVESIALGVPIQISINMTNTFYDNGSVSMNLILDNETIDNVTIDIDPFSSKNVTITIPTEITENIDYGSHLVEIIPTSSNTMGFDLYAIFNVIEMEIKIPARFYYRDLRTDKLIIKTDEMINITVAIENKGKAGTHPVGILINDVLVEEKDVSLNFSEVRDINFSFVIPKVGEYRITINDTNLSKVFFVESEEEVLPEVIKAREEERRISTVIIMLGLSVLVILIYIVRKKIISKGIRGEE